MKAPALLAVIVFLPVAAGLIGTLLPAFDYLPALGRVSFGLSAWRELLSYPGVFASLRLSVTTGLVATLLALVLAAALCVVIHGRKRVGARALLAPLLAAPHAAMAIGLAFLIAPSGWIARLFSPWLTGWSAPPDIASVQDPYGFALILGLVVKETPFLLLTMLAALNQIPAGQQLRAARALGYAPGAAWVSIILPQVYAQVRLPVFAVLAYALSVVDMALVLGPANPPPLAVLALRWFTAPDVTQYFPAAAAAVLQLGLVLACIAIWRLGEGAARALQRRWVMRGARGRAAGFGLTAGSLVGAAVLAAGLTALLALALWSFAWSWRFPDALPAQWTLDTWARQSHALLWPLTNTLLLGAAATGVSFALCVALFESGARGWLAAVPRFAYLPLLVPQIAFLFGTQAPLDWLALSGSFLGVAWAHLLFVFPYMMLALADPWRALDRRYARAAAALGASPWRILLDVKLPLLLRPALGACAIGFAVSAAQYLPTLFAGAGRVPTLTTDAVALSSGADRRVVAVFAFLQAVLPLLVYLAALGVPALAPASRRAGKAMA